MRRRRSGLQVSTFPFLAVLLCAMGSLILLLLVIDRRAKIVARNKALAAQELAQLLDETEMARRREEWERQRHALHALLAAQLEQLKTQLKNLRSQSVVAVENLRLEQARHQAAAQALARGKEDLDRLRASMAQWRSAIAKTRRDEEKAHALQQQALQQQAIQQQAQQQQAIQQLARDLIELEQTLEALKLARRRQEQAFSLVPYGGKRGDTRKPVYVECNRSGLTFYPQPRTLPDYAIGLAAIRTEVDRRAEAPQRAYLLFLVRPDGITAYTLAQGALRGSSIDYGYELVEADWEFDFASEERLAAQPRPAQPWQAPPAVGSIAQPGSASVLGPPRVPPPLTSHRDGDGGLPGFHSGNRGAPPGTALNDGNGATTGMTPSAAGTGSGAGTTPGVGVATGSPSLPKLGFNGGDGGGSGEGTVIGGGIAKGSKPDAAFPSEGTGNATSGGQSNASGVPRGQNGKLSGPWKSVTPGWPADSSTAPGPGQGGAAKGSVNPGWPPGLASIDFGNAGGQAPGGQAPGGQAPNGPRTGGAEMSEPGALPRGQGPTSPTEGSPKPGAAGPWQGRPSSPAGTASPDTSAPEDHSANEPPPRIGLPPPPDAESGDGPGLPYLGGPRFGTAKPKARPVVPLSRMLGNRDYAIVLECTEEAIVIQPWGIRFENGDLPMRPDPNHKLVQTITKLIARRQATVRQGEPPYRPVLRFQIQPGGLRSYYLAYPMLESLHLPMTRENAQEEGR